MLLVELKKICSDLRPRSFWNLHRNQWLLCVCSRVFCTQCAGCHSLFYACRHSWPEQVLPCSILALDDAQVCLVDLLQHLRLKCFGYYDLISLEQQTVQTGEFISVRPVLSDSWRYIFSVVGPSFENHTAQGFQFQVFCRFSLELCVLFW